MITKELIHNLGELTRSEKLHVMQLLVSDLAREEALLISSQAYPIWSPYDATEAAVTMLEVLNEDEARPQM